GRVAAAELEEEIERGLDEDRIRLLEHLLEPSPEHVLVLPVLDANEALRRLDPEASALGGDLPRALAAPDDLARPGLVLLLRGDEPEEQEVLLSRLHAERRPELLALAVRLSEIDLGGLPVLRFASKRADHLDLEEALIVGAHASGDHGGRHGHPVVEVE